MVVGAAVDVDDADEAPTVGAPALAVGALVEGARLGEAVTDLGLAASWVAAAAAAAAALLFP